MATVRDNSGDRWRKEITSVSDTNSPETTSLPVTTERQIWTPELSIERNLLSDLLTRLFFQVSGQDQDFCIQVSSKTKTFPTKVSRQDQDFGILVSSKTKTFPQKISRQEQDLAPNSYALGKYPEFMNKYYHWHQLFIHQSFLHSRVCSLWN